MSDEIVSTAPAAVPDVPHETIAQPVVKTEEVVPEPVKTLTLEEQQKKFDRDAAAQRRKYERDLQNVREQNIRLEERLNQFKPTAAPEPGEPQLKDYTDFDEYVADKASFIADKKINDTLAKQKEQAATERAQAARQQSAEGFQQRAAEFAKVEPSFHDRMSTEANDVPMSDVMKDTILESPNGPKLALYLLDHPEEAAKMMNMTPIGAVRALTLIEEGFKKPVAVTNATPPISPTGSRSTAVKSLTEITSQSEFEKRRRETIAKRR